MLNAVRAALGDACYWLDDAIWCPTLWRAEVSCWRAGIADFFRNLGNAVHPFVKVFGA